MSDPQSAGDSRDNAIAKTAGVVVFSGIAMSILKTLNPLNKNRTEAPPLAESTQPIPIPSQPPPPKEEPILKKHVACVDQEAPKAPESSCRKIEIVKGDTLWGLSRKYGVSIDVIKEANGLKTDTIYAGRKLIIP